jgi:xylulokinase
VQLRADICGKPFLFQDDSEAVCRGAAILAGAAIGRYAGIGEAASALSRPYRAVNPDPQRGAAYTPQMEKYRSLYPGLTRFREGGGHP